MKRPTDAFWDELVRLDASLASLSYYQLLGVEGAVGADDLRAAYERQIRVLHPDRHARERSTGRKATLTRVYARVAEAYRVLSHPQHRASYDAHLTEGQTRFRKSRTEGSGAKAADPNHPQARSLFEQATLLLRAGDIRGARAKLALARQYEPGSHAIASALLECQPRVEAPLPAPAAAELDPLGSEAPPTEPPAARAGKTQVETAREFGDQPSRVHTRVPLGQSIQVSCKTWQEIESFYMQNISRGGMLLRCKTQLPIGTILELSVLTPDRESIELPAEVVRHVEPKREGQRPGIGIKFLLIPEPVRERFESLLKGAGLSPASEPPPPAPASPNAEVIEAARSLINAGRYSQACQELQLPVRKSPDDATLRSLFHLAAGLMARERSQDAAAHTHFERALRLAPDSPMLLRLLRDSGA